jgi:hypothetical protein
MVGRLSRGDGKTKEDFGDEDLEIGLANTLLEALEGDCGCL